MASSSKLLIIGDSIALGAAEVRGGEMVERIQPNFIELLQAAMPDLSIRVDAGIMRTTASVRPVIDKIIARHAPLHDLRVLLLIGGSDADMDWKRFILSDGAIARSRVPVERYDDNLRFIVGRLLEAGALPILTDIPNRHLSLCGPYMSALAGKDVVSLLDRSGGQAESDTHLRRYRAAVAQIADDFGLALVRLGEALDKHLPADVVCADGTHPNAAGHRIIAQEMIAALDRPQTAAAELHA